ncbi:50S ribosomal subunit maturation GTPase RbgA [Methylophaga frappieri]|uniref:Ribosome biogenesis GTPase A n=1 Tax=Methylophaga frappieri (strain ATCC BAA-2434 / DSM 25690 / JAM7) TaxID=754477 RepID=I1YIK7_METFJ|nr:ribosome biogenesis GTPase YlqF [Methylophaga frappieri]AFJ02750.1 50S ribosomal subunit maturation GTPase RbgA [Methylophaga frappieri]
MAIQWYPGHMYKAGQEIKKRLPEVDLVIEVLDARIPFSSANPLLERLGDGKPCLKILNKADLADPQLTQQWQTFLERDQGVKTLAITALQGDSRQLILQLAEKLVPAKSENSKKIQALIMGIPNVGKSTLINLLSGRAIAKTGNEPAITKMQQRIKVGDRLVLHDTPGMLWPNLENPGTGYRLAITGAIKETAFENIDIALYAVSYLRKTYPQALKQRFLLDTLSHDDLLLITAMAAKRGCLQRGGSADFDRISKLMLTELRAGKICPVTLETPEMMLEEQAQLVKIRAEKAEKKALRKQRRAAKVK